MPTFTALPRFVDEDVETEELGSATKGKEAELIVLGKLLERGFKVYTPLVDTGIDCLVDVGKGTYKEIQVKSREGTEPTFLARKFQPRDNFYFVCFLRGKRDDDYWILPSKVFSDMGSKSTVKNKDYVTLRIGKEGSESYASLAKYHSNWGLLVSGATTEIKRTVERASQRVEGKHLSQGDYETEVLKLLRQKNLPVGRKEIIAELKNALGSRFSGADLAILKNRKARWENTARWAISGLASQKLIERQGKNQWVITEKGRTVLTAFGDLLMEKLNR
jgi:hypothetical protein